MDGQRRTTHLLEKFYSYDGSGPTGPAASYAVDHRLHIAADDRRFFLFERCCLRCSYIDGEGASIGGDLGEGKQRRAWAAAAKLDDILAEIVFDIVWGKCA